MARKRRASQANFSSGLVGGILLGFGCLWLGWLLLSQHGDSSGGISLWPSFPGVSSNQASDTQLTALAAEGITLNHTDQTPKLSQQQATLIAAQLEPDAAAKAKATTTRYGLLNYPVISTPATHANLSNLPVWMIWYQRIPLEASDSSIDTHPYPRPTHDLYVFLDANSGKEVLSIWI